MRRKVRPSCRMSTQVFPGTPFVQRHEVSVKDVNE